MKVPIVLLVLIISVPTMSQASDMWYVHGGVGNYWTQWIDGKPVWHAGVGFQINERFGIELNHWPGFKSSPVNVDDVELSHTSLSATFRAWRVYQNPDVHFVFKGGISYLESTNHEDIGRQKIQHNPIVMAAGIVINPQAKRSWELSMTRTFERVEYSEAFKASVRFKL